MGLITTLLFYKYMMQFDQETVIQETLVDIVVAKEAIAKNKRITSDLIETISISPAGVHPNAVKTDSDIIGSYATSDITVGEQFLSHRLSHEREESLFVSRKVKEGYRAVAVGANRVRSVSNLIEPDDWVDIIFTNEDKESIETIPDMISEILLEKVHVLAVDRRMIESIQGSVHLEYSSITLELKPADAVKLINAAENGLVHFILHSRIVEGERIENAR